MDVLLSQKRKWKAIWGAGELKGNSKKNETLIIGGGSHNSKKLYCDHSNIIKRNIHYFIILSQINCQIEPNHNNSHPQGAL